MSEEILKALMQLFAIIAKQDDGATASERKFVEEFLYFQLSEDLVKEYLTLYDEFVGPVELDAEGNPVKKLTSVKDSVKTLGICKKINKTLSQKQKVIVLVRLLELIAADRSFTEQRMAIIQTVSEVFNFVEEEYQSIVEFCVKETEELKLVPEIMVISDDENEWDYSCKHISSKLLGSILILRVVSEDLYFLKYTGQSDIILNGLPVNPARMYLFAPGSTIKVPGGKPIFYSDIISKFRADSIDVPLSFHAKNISYVFPNGAYGLRNINIAEGSGKLIGLMGSSGAGKTTLLNALSGIEQVSEGQVLINGSDINKEKDKIKGIIGYIPQDDLLIEELTVFENLFYNAKLCFKDATDEEITEKVMNVLSSLGLAERKDLKVGNPLQKTISGGQRKRLNIGLELIREPAVLFVDEPTSGLSSRDSENVMDLLRELTLKGKLIFVVIHQPSSDIYKMFDKMIFLDVGGYQIFYGNPVEAVVYFKKSDNQANAEQGQCLVCGTVNPELVFNIIESKIVDDFGNFTNKRKVSPEQWYQLYLKNAQIENVDEVKEQTSINLNIPSWLKQMKIFATRDFLSKLSNKQYLWINLLEAPILAFVLAFIIRYTEIPGADYLFRENDNIPAFIFMSIIVMLFIGLTVSAEEIFRDQKILKRERFLNLSKSSYLVSKLLILFSLSAIQSLLFVVIGNSIVGIYGMYWDYWWMLFSVACFANLLGLNISASFNSAVTIYILIPLIVIPQMILGGAMFSFDKLNRAIGGGEQVPIIAEVMTSRWAFEGLMVDQFMNNPYEKPLFEVEKKESMASFKQAYYIPKLQELMNDCVEEMDSKNASDLTERKENLKTIKNELLLEQSHIKTRVDFSGIENISSANFNDRMIENTQRIMDELAAYYAEIFNVINAKKMAMVQELTADEKSAKLLVEAKDDYTNDYLNELVTKSVEKNKIIVKDNYLIQKKDPVFLDASSDSFLNFRSHFFAPNKNFFGNLHSTFGFNVFIIWSFSVILYIVLYFDGLKRGMDFISKKIVLKSKK
jgi:ABC-type multidrug transport system ATPase subunit